MESFFNIANNITFGRIIISFVATAFILVGDIHLLMVAIILIAFSELTDILDGYLARRDGCVTKLGKLLDPLSDSISRFFYFFAFAYNGMFPFWLVLFLFLRDIIVAYIRTYMSLFDITMGARTSGKIKAFAQFLGQYTLLFMLVLLLLSNGSSYSEEYLIYSIIVGSIGGFSLFYILRVEGKYLVYSVVGYLFFLVPFYLINKVDMSFSYEISTCIMIMVVAVTLYSLIDYLYAFVKEVQKHGKSSA
jgi:CDP-diacylglycerol--glycerol-3-phosphate 3-phosphatidyltransferase